MPIRKAALERSVVYSKDSTLFASKNLLLLLLHFVYAIALSRRLAAQHGL